MKKGDFYVLDKDFKTLMHIDVYYSMIWTDRYNEAGDFELCIAPSDEVSKYCIIDNYIWYNNSETLMFIEKVEYRSSFEEGPQLIISGRDLKSILARRILLMPEVYNGNFQNAVESILKRTIIEPLTLWHSEDGWSDQPRTATGFYVHTTTMQERLINKGQRHSMSEHDITGLGDTLTSPTRSEDEEGNEVFTFEYLANTPSGYFSDEEYRALQRDYEGYESLPDKYKPYYVKEEARDPGASNTSSIVHKIEEDENKKLVEVTEKKYYNSYDDEVETYEIPFTYVVYQQKDPCRTITNFRFEASEDSRITGLTIAEEFSVGTNCLDAISAMCKAVGCGFKVTTETNDLGEMVFVFQLYMGEDRSFAQIKNPYVVFSEENNNLVSMDTKIDRGENYSNFAYYSAGSDFKDEVGTGEKGLYRKETHTSIQMEDEEREEGADYSQAWKDRARQRAKDYLLEKAESIEGEVKVEPDVNYEFGKDYNVGDIVQTETEWGFNYRLRVTEFITNYSPSGLLMYPTLTEIVDILDEEEEQ